MKTLRAILRFIGFAFLTAVFVSLCYWTVRLVYFQGVTDGIKYIMQPKEQTSLPLSDSEGIMFEITTLRY